MSSFNKAQISFEFYAALSVALLLFLSSLLFTNQMKINEEERQIMLSSFMLAQQVANAADVMHRNLCADECQLSLLLPNRIKGVSFPKEVEYNITFQSNWVIVTPAGYPSVRVAASIPFEGLRVSLEQTEEGKILRMEGGG